MNPTFADLGTIETDNDLLLVNRFLLPFIVVAILYLAATGTAKFARFVRTLPRPEALSTTATPLPAVSTHASLKR